MRTGQPTPLGACKTAAWRAIGTHRQAPDSCLLASYIFYGNAGG